jgi:hypothetical protein
MPLLKLKKISFALLLIVFATACAPTYPVEKLEQQTKELIKKETGSDSFVVLKDKTLFVYVDIAGINTDLSASNDVYNMIQEIVMLATRVSLSTNAKIDVYHVTIASEKNGLQIIFKQYIEDIKCWFYGTIGRSDFFKRSLMETKIVEKGTAFDPKTLKPITMPDFILAQTVYRFTSTLGEEIQELKQQRIKNIKDEAKVLTIDEKIKTKTVWTLLAENTLIKKEYDNQCFRYEFKKFDEANLLNINYKDFHKNFADVHNSVCDIYKFKQQAPVDIELKT